MEFLDELGLQGMFIEDENSEDFNNEDLVKLTEYISEKLSQNENMRSRSAELAASCVLY